MSEFRQWRVNFEDAGGCGAYKQVPDPPGYSPSAAREGSSTALPAQKRKEVDLRKKEAALNARAVAPFKQVAFMCFVMFMSGNTIQIFSLMMTVSGIAGPLQAILKSGDAFPADSDGLNTFAPRLLYCLIHGLQLIFGLYKLNSMGLLPTHASDWVSALVVPRAREFSSGGIGM